MALLATLRFDAAQRAFNSLYYGRGGGYARDFSTYASSGTMPARAEADDFHGRLRGRFGKRAGMEIRVAEIGCGNGNNARRFLERVRRLDALRGTAFAPSVSYTLADFSREMLADAKRSALLSRHPGRILAEAANAERLGIGGGFMLARSNEVLDDLPARMLSKTAKGFSEAWLELHLPEGAEARDKRGRTIGFRELGDALSSGSAARLAGIDGALAEKLELEVVWKPAGIGSAAREAVEASLPGIPGGTVIPLPLGAVKCLEGVHRALGDGGIYDVFDYGFDSVKGLLSLQPGIFRTPGALTAFVNFPFLVYAARKTGYRKACLELQRDFTGGNEDRRFYHLRLVK